MAPSRVAGGLTQSSSSSGIFFQGDGQSQAVVNSRLSSPYENLSNSIPGTGRPNLGPISGDMNSALLNGVANSGPSVGASSLVTDANSALSGGPHLQRSASFNTESYMRLPASPMSFSSNNIGISGSSVVDGSSVGQLGSHQDPSVQQMQNSQLLQQGASTATSLPALQTGQVSLPMGPRVPGSMQDPNNLSQVQKKLRLDIKQEDILQQQVLQKLLQRQDSMQLQARNPQLQALFQQQRLRQQQQILQSMPPSQRAQLQQQQQQQMQFRQQMQQQGMQQVAGMKRPFDGGVCARRLMQYLYHQRQRPPDNTFAYWRKFVAEYYSPRAKKRWCLSMYENVGSHALGVFPQAAMDVWHCDICGSKSGRGFEATFEVLPRLNEIKFGSGVVDELLFLDLPRESRFPSGIMMLEYGKAVQESVYEQLRVVREGQLRIIFTQDLKILSWEFCARRHEELFPRRLVAPQVNQLLQVAQKCQSTISEGGSEGVSQQNLQTNSNMVLTAGRQLVKSLELQSLNDLGFSKRYVRCLQIAEVVSSMKDLIDFCGEHKVGPIDGLKNYPRHASAAKLQMQKMQEMEQLANAQGLSTDRNTLNKLMALHPGISNPMGGSQQQMVGRGSLSGSAQAAMALSNHQNMLSRQNSMNSNPNSVNQEASSSFNNSNQSPSSNFQGPAAVLSGSMQILPVSGLSRPHLPTQQQLTVSGNNLVQKNHQQPSQGNQVLQQQMMQQLYHEMSNNNTGAQQQQSVSGQNGNASSRRNGLGFGSNTTAQPAAATSNVSGSAAGAAPSRSNSFKGASNSDSSAAVGNAGFNQRAPDLPQSLHLQDDIVSDIAQEFLDSGFFNSELDYFDWKA
ncbi:putative transcriptional regulator SLK1 [Hibiscus syriacus]|uniref:Transcriptional regulator SLK1 n=1 Tax=Hibiscus syriacus TaxID=106335 RepID=A0A6A2WP97_HIBSY|nr:probable transcriptional regulator SLK2 [Hibiscus syriacus]KAE8662118.1 putative transcriptional regulator SLK1 [Hibiscus syriacus]